MSQVLFFIAAIGALAGAVAVVTLRNPFFSVLALVMHLLALAALFLLLHAQFLAASQIIVYAGAEGPGDPTIERTGEHEIQETPV